jgi:pyruvate/2-oxoglutarate dehydrogenase complex dihydrolipoamide dehydrogenase (E3) component
MAAIRTKVLGVVQSIYEEETPRVFAEKGVDVVLGAAEFVDSNTIRVEPKAGGATRTITASSFVVATGAVPRVPFGVQGIDVVPYFTYETIFHNARLPRKLVVLGGGPIGCELAQAYAFLGAEVTIVSRELLGKETHNAREVMETVFRENGIIHAAARPASISCTHDKAWQPADVPATGVRTSASPHDADVMTPAEAFAFNRVEPEYTITLKDGTVLIADMLLVSVGRAPIVEPLNLPAAGVKLTYGAADSTGKKPIVAVPVDGGLHTNVKHIYVAGDANDGPQFTHLAGKQGFVGARNSLFPGSFPGHTNALPRVTFTTPEVASVGLTLEAAESKYGEELRVSRRNNAHIDRSVCDDDMHGFVEMYYKPDGSVIGATCVGSRAGEQIGLFIAAMTHNLKAADLAGVMTAYPTHLIGVQQVASSAASEAFLETKLGKFGVP